MVSYILLNMHQQITKNQIRQQIKKQRLALASHQIDAASKVISEKLVTLDRFKAASIIFLYAAKAEEVQTKLIFDRAKALGKVVAFPKVCSETKTMAFYIVDKFEALINNQYGKISLLQPDPARHFEVLPDENTLMIAPGLVFDYNKNRIGYGGGFYDKYLTTYNVYTVGICFDFQIAKEIDKEPFDRPVKVIISERQIID